MQAEENNLAIIGGGISGLISAYYANLSEPGRPITVYEREQRVGGKIESEKTGGSWADRGAEFIDTTDKNIVEVCRQLGVALVPTGFENMDEIFRLPNGGTVSADIFYEAIKPIREKIIADKVAISTDPYGKRAQELDNISLEQYLDELTLRAPVQGERPLFSRIDNFIQRALRNFRKDGKVDPQYIKTLASSYTSESGNDPRDVSALQFVRESSLDKDKLITSDCAFRVEGGTETLIKALHGHLESRGVKFNFGSKLKEVNKNYDNTFSLTMEGADGNVSTLHPGQAILALPSYALRNVQGLENMGLSPEDLKLIDDTQYTHSAKFSIKLKEGANLDDVLMFAPDGWQAWRGPCQDTVTFLVGGKEMNNQKKGGKLVEYCLGCYAQSVGRPVEEVFDRSQIVFGGPDKEKMCYASPARTQALRLSRLTDKVAGIANNTGLGIVGTFLNPDEGVGFMQCGAKTAEMVVAGLDNYRKSHAAELQQAQFPPGYHVEKYVRTGQDKNMDSIQPQMAM